MKRIFIETTKRREVVDVTKEVEALVMAEARVSEGLVHLFALHTTVGLSIAEFDPGTDLDMLDAFEHMVPKLHYRHKHDPEHVPDHILSTVIGQGVTVPFSGGRLILGQWQRIALFEFDGPRERELALTFIEGK